MTAVVHRGAAIHYDDLDRRVPLASAADPVVFWLNVGKVLPAPVRSLLVNAWESLVPTIVPVGAVSDAFQVLGTTI